MNFAKCRKLQEAISLNVIKEIFKLPPHLHPFGYVNYLYELSLGHPNNTRKYVWAGLQTFRRRFRKLQEAILICSLNFFCYFESKIRSSSSQQCLQRKRATFQSLIFHVPNLSHLSLVIKYF